MSKARNALHFHPTLCVGSHDAGDVPRVTFPDGTHEDVEYELFEVAKAWDRQGRVSVMGDDAVGRLTRATDGAGGDHFRAPL